MDIGTKIKNLRLERNVTQEALAEHLGVTAQAVSKWERGVAAPDISLLPELSVFFGVRIDDFFELNDAARFERINRMLENEGFLSHSDFEYAERCLKDACASDPGNAEACRMLADLYNHRADGYHRKAEILAKRSLELEPTKKAGHSLLSFAANGACWDWCCSNHHELIDYYYHFTAKNPGYLPGYLWLLDNLLDDRRLEEADQVVNTMEQVEDTFHTPLYRGHIAILRGDSAAAEKCWQIMRDRWPEDWMIWSVIGDAYVKQCRYDEAVENFEKAASLEQAPRYIDNWESIAEIRQIQGRWQEAADAYDKVADIQTKEWSMAEDGFAVSKYRNLAREMRTRT